MPSKVILNYKTIELNSFSSKQLLKHLKSKFQIKLLIVGAYVHYYAMRTRVARSMRPRQVNCDQKPAPSAN